MFNNLFAIFIGGGIGASLRYLITCLCKNTLGMSFVGTFSVNMIGCFLIGFIFGITMNKLETLPQVVKLFVMVGFLGSLTTFSTFSLEIIDFIRNGKILIGIGYLLLSCIFGLILTFFGIYLSKFS